MERSSTTLIIVMLIVGLGIGAGVGYYAAPAKEEIVEREVIVEKNPLEGTTIKIGGITAATADLEIYSPFYKELIEVDINEFLNKLGYDVSYEVLMDEAQGEAPIHLEKVQSFKAMEIDLIIGGSWSSHAEASLGYVNDNDMLLFSPSSSSPLIAFPDDNLYRMSPTHLKQVPAIAEMLWSWGIKACLVIQRGDTDGDGLYNILEKEYPKRGGVILGKIRYAPEVTEFSSYVETANGIISEAVEEYGAKNVGVLMVSFEEGVNLVMQAADYPILMDIYWFATDGTTFETRHLKDAPKESAHLKLFGTLAAPGYSPKFHAFRERFRDLLGMEFMWFHAAHHDTHWVLLHSVLEAGSVNALDVIPMITPISNDFYGVSGWCKLNENGDRDLVNYDIWGIDYVDGEPAFVKYGMYDGITGKVSWDTSLITPGSLPPEWVP